VTSTPWLLPIAAVALAVYLVFVAALFVAGRRTAARALAGFIPDCLVLLRRLLGDDRVPRRRKLVLIALLGYLATPVDLVPDFVPVAGQLDDAIIAALALRYVLRAEGSELLRDHWPGPEASLRIVVRLAYGRADIGMRQTLPPAMPGQVLQRWRLILKVAPLVAIAALIKIGLDLQGWEPIPLSPLYTGVVAATVFLLGFLLAGTLSDYKESEKLPGDLAASMETIADECLILYRDKRAGPALECLRHIRGLVGSLLGWFHRREETAAVTERITGLNRFFLAFEPLTQPNFIVRLKQEQSAIRRMVIRIETIRDTSFVGAGYAIAELATFLLVVGLLLAEIGPDAGEVFLVSSITFLLVYVIYLIRDLDDPFEYALDGSKAGAAEVSLRPIERLEPHLEREIELLDEGRPPEEAARASDERA
jgi:uncharacterized membrane protein YkvA (DUF1232 family)